MNDNPYKNNIRAVFSVFDNQGSQTKEIFTRIKVIYRQKIWLVVDLHLLLHQMKMCDSGNEMGNVRTSALQLRHLTV